MTKEKFNDFYKMDLIGVVEKDYKGLNYLSWASAYKLAMEQDPNMSFEVLEDVDGFPMFSRGKCHMVKTTVTMFGETKKMMLPVMDNKHNAVAEPNTRQINDNIMRCLVKNIALFGIGLSLYIGEDLEQFTQTPSQLMEQAEKELKEKDTPTPKERRKAIQILNELASKEEILKVLEETGIESLETASKSEFKYLLSILKQKKRNKESKAS